MSETLDTARYRQPDAGRRGQRAAVRRRKRKRRRSLVSLLIAVLVLAAAVGGAWLGLRPLLESVNAPDDYPGPGTGEVVVVVEPGDSGSAIARTLEDQGVILEANTFLEAGRSDPRVAKIQPGTYRLKKEMSVAGAIDVLANPANRVFVRVTVPEGLRVEQVAELLADKGRFPRAELDAALASPQAIGLPAAAQGNPEGWLFPSTYDFEPGTSAAQALGAMVARTASTLTELGVAPEKQHEVLTKASLVEAEGGTPEDFGKVARVVENRLAADMPLQFDSTVNYATKTYEETTTDAQRAVDSPYNTYRYKGITPAPIESPGEAAIQAVLNPEAGEWLYFVTVNLDTGETRFATTLEEHQANVAVYQAWLRANR